MHTPGPWRLGPINYADIYGGESGELVALAIKDLPETVDNARLIAAAPDLLKAARSFASLYYGHKTGDCTPPGCAICRCRAAIAKAEGK